MHKKMHLYTNQYTQMQNETNFEGASGTATKDIWTLLAPLDTNVRWAFTRLCWLDIFTAAVAPSPLLGFNIALLQGVPHTIVLITRTLMTTTPPPINGKRNKKKRKKPLVTLRASRRRASIRAYDNRRDHGPRESGRQCTRSDKKREKNDVKNDRSFPRPRVCSHIKFVGRTRPKGPEDNNGRGTASFSNDV